MNEVIVQDNRYPVWMKAWNARSAEIDQQLMDYCSETTEQTSEALDSIGSKLQGWWDKQHLDEKTAAEWQKVKADSKLYKAQIDNRIEHLIADKKIAWARRDQANKAQ